MQRRDDLRAWVRKPLLCILRLIGHQGWIRYGLRSRIIRLFTRSHVGRSFGFQADFLRFKFTGDLNNDIDWEVFFFGQNERDVLELITDLLRKKTGPICLDVGANCGTHSLVMSGFSAQVHSFEPDTRALAALKENVKINNIGNIHVHDFALGDKTCEMDLYLAKNGDSGWSTFVYQDCEPFYDGRVPVKVMKGDDIIEELGLRNIDLIKIDVEGYEKNVLMGLKKTISRFRPVIIMEFTDFTHQALKDKEELAHVIKGYETYEIKERGHTLFFFERRGYRLTKFDFTNFDFLMHNVLCLPGRNAGQE